MRMPTNISARRGREEIAVLAQQNAAELRADDEVLANPSAFYDQIVEIDLSKVEPHLNGPFTPDAATPISHMKAKVLPMTILW